MNAQTLTTTMQPNQWMAASSSVVDAFLQGRKVTTLRTYQAGLDDFCEFVKADDVNAAASLLLGKGHGAANRMALAYRADMVERKLSAATVNNRLAALRSLVKLANTLGMVPWKLDVENVKAEPYRDTRGPGAAVFTMMLSTLDNSSKDKRDRAALRLLHDVALRRAEVVNLDLADVDLKAGTLLVVRKGKTEKTTLTLPAPTLTALREWIEVRGAEAGPLLLNFDPAGKGKRLTGTSLYRIVRGVGEMVGTRTRPHGLRHTAITTACRRAAESGIPLEEVLDFSGHANVRTLMIYRDRVRNMQGRLAAMVATEE